MTTLARVPEAKVTALTIERGDLFAEVSGGSIKVGRIGPRAGRNHLLDFSPAKLDEVIALLEAARSVNAQLKDALATKP